MITLIIIFGVSLLATIIFIYVRIHNIRTGKVAAPKDSVYKDRKIYTKVVETKKKTAWYGRNIFKLAILILLKLFVFIGFIVKQVVHESKEHLKEKMTPKKNAGSKNPSAFLSTIREYKNELSKFQKGLDKK